MMSLVVISIISIIISGILTFFIDDIWLSKTMLSYTGSMIANGTIFCIIYTILVVMLILGI